MCLKFNASICFKLRNHYTDPREWRRLEHFRGNKDSEKCFVQGARVEQIDSDVCAQHIRMISTVSGNLHFSRILYTGTGFSQYYHKSMSGITIRVHQTHRHINNNTRVTRISSIHFNGFDYCVYL